MEISKFPAGNSTRSLKSLNSAASLSTASSTSISTASSTPRSPPNDSSQVGGGKLLASEDIEFAIVTLTRLEAWPWLDLRITARDVPIAKERVSQLLKFIGNVLFSDDAAKGFGITYDFRKLKNPSVSGLLIIAKWGAEPSRQRLFFERCISCTTCVPPGWKFYATKAAMSAFFLVTPPTCRTYLTTDFDLTGATVVTFDPPEGANSGAATRDSMAAAPNAACGKPRPRPRPQPQPCGGCFAWLGLSGQAAALAVAVHSASRWPTAPFC